MSNEVIEKIFKGRRLVVATMHGKEKIIVPIIEKFLAVEIIVSKNLNTDKFGTFTGEIERTDDQLVTARKKALAAMEYEQVDLGIASEGVFDSHPINPVIQSNLELILLIDRKNNFEVRGHFQTAETNMAGSYISSKEEALSFARKIGFPEHGVILRTTKNGRLGIEKDIHSEEELANKVSQRLSRPFVKQLFIETDMRSHKNPTRNIAIKKATEDLIKNIYSICPHCQTPGFVVTKSISGLKCSVCGNETELPIYDVYLCQMCSYQKKVRSNIAKKLADPQYCDYCNP